MSLFMGGSAGEIPRFFYPGRLLISHLKLTVRGE